ncbi:hypothetical protein HNP84_001843 [Thermocatellispora tengchongensis]|uniref:Histidine kinase n=1 Tax=Thermocatellispora tengchongensis TaxID=1073253 RepID=A0A840P3T2_9ACTN|nr:hypothetical protein [Thermocatellispora tengchongensis]MBB5132130.1 hypothetical protein [Thermocatellispora tengchongensis]
MSEDPEVEVARRYAGAATVAAVVVAACWHLGYDLTAMLVSWERYRWPLLAAGAWAAYLAIGVAGSVALLRLRRPLRMVWAYAAGALALDAAVIAASSPGEVLGLADWGWGSVGWLGLILFWRRRRHLRELIWFLLADGAIIVAGMALAGVYDRVSLARVLMVYAGGVTLQIGASVGGHALAFAARLAAEKSAEQAATEAAREIAERVHADRMRRYEAVRHATADLLTAIAEGADPADPRVRRECAVGAARLRRLMTETDDVPDPLLATLREHVLDAERRGVVVSLEPPVGTIPELPAGVRHSLARAPLEALRRARGEARVTVYAGGGEVIVSVVADAEDVPVEHLEGVQVTQQREGRSVWIQSRCAVP